MKYIILLTIIFIGCGPASKLRKAERLIKGAIANGAKVKGDTVYKDFAIRSKPIDFNTKITSPANWNSVLVKGKDSVSVQIKRVPGKPGKVDTLYIAAKCPEQVIEGKVPVAVNQKISAGYTLWDMIILAIFCLLVGTFLGPIVRNSLRKK